MLEPGTRLGDYEIESELGAGGMAHVYKARHAVLDTHHAIKVLLAQHRENAEVRKRFLDEARIQAKHLDHPNIVKVTGIVSTPEHAALVMELVEGKSLEDELPTLKAHPAEIVRIMLAVLDAVGSAHKAGIIHRDLKPANVLLARKGQQTIPKVTDFGIAKLAGVDGGPKKSTHADARMGTLNYMAPEQIRRAKDVTARSDIFSLGAMLYEMATGQLAFDGDNDFDVMEAIAYARFVRPTVRYPDIDPNLAVVIEKALAAEPNERYASCEEMAEALRPPIYTTQKMPVHVAPAPPASQAPQARQAPPAKRSLMIGIGLVAVALAIAFVGVAFVLKKAPSATGGTAGNAVVLSAAPTPKTPVWCVGGFTRSSGTIPDHACLAAGPARGVTPWHWHEQWFVTNDGNSCYTCWDSDDVGCAAAVEHGWRVISAEQCERTGAAAPTTMTMGNDEQLPAPSAPARPADAQMLPSGAGYQVLRAGEGPTAEGASVISMIVYRWADNGRLNETTSTAINDGKDLPGLSELLSLMQRGARARMWIPGNLLHGGLPVVVDVEMIGFEAALAPNVGSGTRAPPRPRPRPPEPAPHGNIDI